MCAGTVNLELSERLTSVDAAMPSEWYSEEDLPINAGTLDATAGIYITNLVVKEDAIGGCGQFGAGGGGRGKTERTGMHIKINKFCNSRFDEITFPGFSKKSR